MAQRKGWSFTSVPLASLTLEQVHAIADTYPAARTFRHWQARSFCQRCHCLETLPVHMQAAVR